MTGKQRQTQERGGRYSRYECGETPRAVARALYESRPGTTIADVSTEMGIPTGTLRRWKSESAKAGSPWRAKRRALPELSGRAAAIADQHRVTLAAMGPSPTDAQRLEAEELVADMVAADARAQIITKHRSEWVAVRALLHRAIKSGEASQALVVRDLAETMDLVQKNERRTWGLDSGAFGPGTDSVLVIVERREGP